jgi:hypothetical protein
MLPSKYENAPSYLLPSDARIPSDLAQLELEAPDANGAHGWIVKLEQAASRERSAYILSLIVEARSI